MSRTVLVLGAGPAQVDLAEAARSRFERVVAVGSYASGPMLDLVDAFEVCELRDDRALAAVAERIQPDAVVSAGSDLAARAQSRLTERWPTPPSAPTRVHDLFADKARFRSWLDGEGLGGVLHAAGEVPDVVDAWTLFPAVVKPVASQGQRGVRRVSDRIELLAAARAAAEVPGSGDVLVEDYLKGPEVSLSSFYEAGRPCGWYVGDRSSATSELLGIPASFRFPSRQSTQDVAAVIALTEEVCARAGLTEGPVYVQARLTPDGPRLLEVAPRLDGCHLWRVIRAAYGVDLLAMLLDSLGGPAPGRDGARPQPRPHELHFDLQLPGADVRPAESDGGAVCSVAYYRPGEVVRPVNGVLEKVGYRVVEAP